MPLNPNAAIEITAFERVPDFAKGVVRDLRARWALEEAGLPYAASTFLVDETVVRQSLIDAYDAVKLNGADPAGELDFAVQTVQELYDDFWAE